MLFSVMLIISGLGNVFLDTRGIGFNFYIAIGSLITGIGINYFYWFRFLKKKIGFVVCVVVSILISFTPTILSSMFF